MRRSVLMFVVAGLVGALVAVPVAVWASHSFSDVPDSNTFHADIEWLADAGVTKGCNPPANTEFCPKDNVTREQMAAFLRRLAENQVVDAATLQGMTTDQLLASVSGPIVEHSTGPGINSMIPPTWNTADPNDKTEVLTVTIDVPSDGVVVVTAVGEVGRNHVNGEVDIIVIDVTDDLAEWDPYLGRISQIAPFAAEGFYSEPVTSHRVFEVTAGTHTFTLAAARPEDFVDAHILRPNMTAMFFPNS